MFFIYPGSGERWNNQQSDGPSSEPPKRWKSQRGQRAGFLAPAPQAVFCNSNIAQIRCFLAPAPLGTGHPVPNEFSTEELRSDKKRRPLLVFLAFEFVTLDV